MFLTLLRHLAIVFTFRFAPQFSQLIHPNKLHCLMTTAAVATLIFDNKQTVGYQLLLAIIAWLYH